MAKAEKKTLPNLLAEHNQFRKMKNKNFVHKESKEEYQLLMTAHYVENQEICGVFCLNAMPQLKFVRPMSEFTEKFEEGHTPR